MPFWEEIVTTKAFDFFVPLDPYLEAHAWGQFGADCATGSHRATTQPLSGYQRVDVVEEGADSVELNAENPSACSFDYVGPFVHECASHNTHSTQVLPSSHNVVLSQQQAQPASKLTEQQLARIEGNRHKAFSIKRARFALLPKVYIPERQEEAVGPPSNFRYHCSTSQHRRKFKFGKITAQDARSNTQSNRPSAESGSACAAERQARQS